MSARLEWGSGTPFFPAGRDETESVCSVQDVDAASRSSHTLQDDGLQGQWPPLADVAVASASLLERLTVREGGLATSSLRDSLGSWTTRHAAGNGDPKKKMRLYVGSGPANGLLKRREGAQNQVPRQHPVEV